MIIIEKEVANYAHSPDDGVSNTLHNAIRLVSNLSKSNGGRNV